MDDVSSPAGTIIGKEVYDFEMHTAGNGDYVGRLEDPYGCHIAIRAKVETRDGRRVLVGKGALAAVNPDGVSKSHRPLREG
ncbi:hypothetical protein HLH33_12005 [Gluconacetobacter diazotrophicus]|uniref:Uncharacterized protein n=1 Tax=Gluconacetobacter diazotrophicus TaxID=33996 RepID=A0A7W4I6A0_GLUDI|nr:hypothetical protein [Gluconacetobacter diazotrophicus]MBB2157024.1 hypothetical protein [Gluconacetobacter diazotrophicus]